MSITYADRLNRAGTRRQYDLCFGVVERVTLLGLLACGLGYSLSGAPSL